MLPKKNFYFFIFFILIFISTYSKSSEYKIVGKVNNEIITNVDLENQVKFLLLSNNNLKNLSKNDLLELSKNSLIKEIIKKKEIDKFINIEKRSNLETKLIEQNYISLGFKNKKEYIIFLKKEGINLELVKRKLVLEHLWGALVYEKFKKQIKIDEKEIIKKIKRYKNQQEKIYELNVSEILFDLDVNLNELNEFIKKYGFKNAALKFSISDTASKGGEIGWVNLSSLSPELQEKILPLKTGEYTKPIKIPSGNLIIKINAKREIKKKFDLEKEKKKQIIFEQNKQINIFSINYYKKLKQNSIINEYR